MRKMVFNVFNPFVQEESSHFYVKKKTQSLICVYKRSFSTTLVTMRFAQWFRLSPRCGYHQPTIQSKQVQHHYSGFKYIYIYRCYTPVYAGIYGIRWCAGIRVVYAWYTRFFSGIRVVYARYTRGSVVCTWYTRGIRWYTLVYYAHGPPATKW